MDDGEVVKNRSWSLVKGDEMILKRRSYKSHSNMC